MSCHMSIIGDTRVIARQCGVHRGKRKGMEGVEDSKSVQGEEESSRGRGQPVSGVWVHGSVWRPLGGGWARRRFQFE